MGEQLRWLRQEWAARLASAIESMTGVPACAEPSDDPAGPAGDGAALFRQPADTGADTQIWVRVPQATWKAIGEKVLQSAGLEETSEEEAQGTFLEVLQQSLSPLAQVLGGKLKREVVFMPGASEDEAAPGLEWAAVNMILAGVQHPPVALAITAGLEEALAKADASETTEAAQATAAASEPAKDARVTRSSKTMDLLLEVELPVGVSFGRVQMKLRDAVKLTTGSIVELNRRVTEPVEVIVNNCVIARGEVVVVEGNYGVRIQEIVSREERLRTLF
ncbi:MAG TPA: flagellar motor switch protein FliN [Bryobacteraceae bacterium]|nr:flagellar motor switch protein FliN [Bryobacteraceae bacterium]HPT26133.1 flagellar motor switch protein FliN [Bryobacteraceae bacterium]